jgi:hypothetical protein
MMTALRRAQIYSNLTEQTATIVDKREEAARLKAAQSPYVPHVVSINREHITRDAAQYYYYLFLFSTWNDSKTFEAPKRTCQNNLAFKAFMDQVEKLAGLSPGWDTYDAEPPNQSAISLAKKTLGLLEEMQFVPYQVGPSVEGGVGIVFFNDGKYADIEFLNSGTVLAVVSDRKSEPEAWEVPAQDALIRSALKKMHAYLAR